MKLLVRIYLILTLAPFGTLAVAHSQKWTSQDSVDLWKAAVKNAVLNKTTDAKKMLNRLLHAHQSTIGEDQILMALGRIEYQENHLDTALAYYQQIPQRSDLWVESVEEKAWTYHRKKDFDKALSELRNLAAPSLAPQVGPEVYYLTSYTHLKMCNYPEILRVHKDFKKQYSERTKVLQNLVNTGSSPSTQKLMEQLRMGLANSWASLGKDVAKLPRMINKDHMLRVLALKKDSPDVAKKIQNRIKFLAEHEMVEMADMVKKLQIIEIEAIQRMTINNRVAQKSVELTKGDDDTLTFPDNGEVWADELNHYEIKGKGCPESTESLMAAAKGKVSKNSNPEKKL